MRKSIISASLLLSFLLAALMSCADSTPSPENNTDTAPSDTSDESAETASGVSDDLPAGLDFGGKTVTFLYRNEKSNEFYSDTANGDIVNDAIYNSIRSVEERLNVNIEAVLRDGHIFTYRQEYMNHITSTILAGDSTYDWVDLMIGNSPVMMRDGIFLDVTQNQYIDLDKPYYLSNLVDTCAIDGKLYFVSGDASLGYIKCAFCMYFNQRLVDDFQLVSPYELVDSGKWTLDKLGEISVAASQDLNGDGKYNIDDKLGFVVHDTNHPYGFWASTESVMYTLDESGEWKFTYGSERDADICNKLYNLFYVNEGGWYANVTNAISEHLETYNQVSAKFASGDIFIMTAELDDSVAQLRDMKDVYGILPYPKADENQENYRSSSRNTHNAFSMPITCADPDMAGAVLEALSSSNHNNVLPAYFEIALKKKYARDDDSSRMYDIIRDTMTLDFGYIYGNAIGSPEGVFSSSYRKENSLASNVASRKTSLEASLDKYLETVRENCT